MGIVYGDISWKFMENRGIQLYPHYIPIIITNTGVHVPSGSKEVFGSMGALLLGFARGKSLEQCRSSRDGVDD